MSDILGEKPRIPEQLEPLSPEDQQLEKKIQKGWETSIVPLSILLTMVTLLEAYSQSSRSSQISAEVTDVLNGRQPTFETRFYGTSPLPTPILSEHSNSQELTAAQVDLSLFEVGKAVLTNKAGVSRPGVVEQVILLPSETTSSISFVVVKFADGTWDAFNPDEITAPTQ